MTREEMKHKIMARRAKKVDYCDLAAVYEIDTETAAFDLVHFGMLYANVNGDTDKINHVYFNKMVRVQGRNVSCTYMVPLKAGELFYSGSKIRFWFTTDTDNQAEARKIYSDWLKNTIDEIDKKKTYLMSLQSKFGL